MIGKKIWAIGDGFMPYTQNGNYKSHEAICVLNTSDQDAHIQITIYFEDKEPLEGFCTVCKARRANHVRLDMIKNINGDSIPYDIPYAILVESDVAVVVQHSRMDVSQSEMTLMTTIAY